MMLIIWAFNYHFTSRICSDKIINIGDDRLKSKLFLWLGVSLCSLPNTFAGSGWSHLEKASVLSLATWFLISLRQSYNLMVWICSLCLFYMLAFILLCGEFFFFSLNFSPEKQLQHHSLFKMKYMRYERDWVKIVFMCVESCLPKIIHVWLVYYFVFSIIWKWKFNYQGIFNILLQ